MLKPSEKLQQALTGKGPVTDDIALMVDRECYLAALEIIRKGDTTEKRKKMLGRIPPFIRPKVEIHIKRLWPIRDQVKSNPRF